MNRTLFFIVGTLLFGQIKAQNCTPTITGTNSICYHSSATLTASGASNYTWSPSTGLSSTTGSVVTASPSVTTQYTITASTGTCVATNTFFLNVRPLPVVSLSPATTTGCATLCVTFTFSPAIHSDTYYWNWGNGQAQIDTSVLNNTISHCYTTPGTFTVTLTVDNGCRDSTTAVVTVNACSGIEQLSSNPQINIYPNPGKGVFIFTTSTPYEKIRSSVTNVLGELIYSSKVENPSGHFRNEINLSEFPDGAYFIQVQTGEEIITKKLIIQH